MQTNICAIGISHSAANAVLLQKEDAQKKMLLRSGTGGLTMAEYLDKEAFKKKRRGALLQAVQGGGKRLQRMLVSCLLG